MMQGKHYHCIYGEQSPLPAFALTFYDLDEAIAQYLLFCRKMGSNPFEGAEQDIKSDDEVAWCINIGPIRAILTECEDCDDPLRN